MSSDTKTPLQRAREIFRQMDAPKKALHPYRIRIDVRERVNARCPGISENKQDVCGVELYHSPEVVNIDGRFFCMFCAKKIKEKWDAVERGIRLKTHQFPSSTELLNELVVPFEKDEVVPIKPAVRPVSQNFKSKKRRW